MLTKIAQTVRRVLGGPGWLLAGLLVGSLGLVVSFGLEGLMSSRPLGDPLPLVLMVTQLPRGLTYLAWQPALYHLLFSVGLGLLAAAGLRWRRPRQATPGEARLAGRVAMLLNVLVVALLAVDAVVVAVWYLMAGVVTTLVCGWLAAVAAGRWQG